MLQRILEARTLQKRGGNPAHQQCFLLYFDKLTVAHVRLSVSCSLCFRRRTIQMVRLRSP